MLLTSAVLVLAQAAGAPARAGFSEDYPGPGRPQCAAVQVRSPQQPRAQPRSAFSATRILDLEFQTLLRWGLAGSHTLQLKVYTPRGHLYQVLTIPFAGSGPGGASGATPEKRWVDGYPLPLDEQQAKAVRFEGARRHQVSANLPVAGTSIMTSSLYGQWRVEPYLDGAPEACGPPRAFVIAQ